MSRKSGPSSVKHGPNRNKTISNFKISFNLPQKYVTSFYNSENARKPEKPEKNEKSEKPLINTITNTLVNQQK